MTKEPVSNQDLQNENVQSAVELAVIANDITYIKKEVSVISEKLEQDYVTRVEFNSKFDPIQKIIYGLVGLILTAVVGALVSLVVLK